MKKIINLLVFTAVFFIPLFAQANDNFSPYLRFGIGANDTLSSTKKGNVRDSLGYKLDTTIKGVSPYYSFAFGIDIEDDNYSFDLEYTYISQIKAEVNSNIIDSTSCATSLYMLNATHNFENIPLFFGIGIGLSNTTYNRNSKIAFGPHIGVNIDKNFFLRGSWIFTKFDSQTFVDNLDMNFLSLQLGVKFNI